MRAQTAALLLAVLAGTAPDARAQLRLLVPLYSYPGVEDPGAYGRAAHQSATAPVTVVVNPCDGPIDPTAPHGPGECTNADHDQHLLAIDTLRTGAASLQILGYVATGYLTAEGSRADSVRHDIDVYAAHYTGTHALDGLFFDEASSEPAAVEVYRALCRYAKAAGFSEVVLNPGTAFDPGYLAADCDAAVAFEDPLDGEQDWATYHLPAPLRSVPPHRLGVLLHDVAGEGPMTAALDSAAARGFGLVYVTDDAFDPNPWDQLAAYWEREAERVAEINATATEAPASPPGLRLSPSRPQPAAGPVALTLTLSAATDVHAEVVDALGRRVATLHDGPLPAGPATLVWDGSVAPGVYVVVARALGRQVARRVVVR